MDEKSLRKLEFDKILTRLATHTGFALSREYAESLLPVSVAETAQQLLAETDEARDILRLYPTFTIGGLWDLRPCLRHLEIGGILNPEELVNISSVLRSARMVKSFYSEIKGSYPITSQLAKGMTIIKTVESAVEKAIGPDGSINDEASERLASLRRRSRQATQRIKERLDSLIRNPATAKYLQDPIVTIRDDRYVVPVKQEYRANVSGVVHDMSASGATIFVEPLAVMELNNEIASIKREEEEEIAAILRGLTMVVNGFAEEIKSNLLHLAQLDFIFAKGKLSYDYDACSPKVNPQGMIRMIKARHPLIDQRKVVPIDLIMDKKIGAMIITGPNTGGKTVTLKTVGLLTVMALSGLHIPVEPGSEIVAFTKVFADIGDEQSIEQSLSTFSAHMSNIVEILDQADEYSLVLLDELGAGTDPTEGAALAQAILKYLQERRIRTVATTHYSELKAFAYNTPGFVNASVEFDVTTLSPTYKLIIGVPGKSNAFEISRRLGLAEQIITSAADTLSAEDAAVTAMLANLEELRREISSAKEETEQAQKALAAREQKILAQEKQLQVERSQVLQKANADAQKIIDETLAKSRSLYQFTKKKLEEQKSAELAYQQAQRKLKNWREQLEEDIPQPVYAGDSPDKVAVGDYVHLPKLNQYGYVLSLPDSDGDIFVQVGVLKLKSALKDVRFASEEMKKNPSVSKRYTDAGRLAVQKARSIEPEIDLHGMDSLEALHLLDKYLDDAFIAGFKQVAVNHGRGMGILRASVHEYLRTHRLVKSYRTAELSEGGIGVTIVVLNQ